MLNTDELESSKSMIPISKDSSLPDRLIGAEEAEDLTQEVFVKVNQNLKTFRGNSQLSHGFIESPPTHY